MKVAPLVVGDCESGTLTSFNYKEAEMRNAIIIVLFLLGLGVLILWFQEMQKAKKGK